MKVSVIIINYNTFNLTCDCIDSIYEHTKSVDFEIVLVDNASKECDPDLFAAKYPEIILVKSNQNLGFSKGNNLGIDNSDGEYILLLNSDTKLLNDAIGKSVEIFNKTKAAGALSGKLIFPDGRIQHLGERFPSVWNEVLELLRVPKLMNKKQKEDFYLGRFFGHEQEKYVDWIWGAFFMTKREIVKKFPSGKLHDMFFMYYEDVQWCYELKRMGYKVLYNPEPKLIHYLSGSDIENRDAIKRYLNKILPNQKKFLELERGKIYTMFFYLIKGLHLFTLKDKSKRVEGRFYLNYIFNNKRPN